MSRLLSASTAPRYLPCLLGDVRLAFDISRLDSIRRSDGVQHNPSSHGPAGWLLDHQEAPVVDLGVWLGLGPRFGSHTSGKSGRILVFNSATGPKGFLVDTSGKAQNVQGGDLHPLPAALGNLSHLGFRGLWTSEDHAWLVLDPDVPSFETRRPEPHDIPDISVPSKRPTIASLDLNSSPRRDHAGRILLFSTRQGEGFKRPVRFALSITQAIEVTALPSLDPVPGAPDFVRGLTIWRQQPLVVIDVDRRMGWPSTAHSDDRLLIAQTIEGPRIGLITSGSPKLLKLPIAHRPGNLTFTHSLVLGVFELEQETIIVPDLREFAEFGDL